MKNKEEILYKIRLLKQYYESKLIKTLDSHEVNPGLPLDDRINYIYFTLPVALNFQRNSQSMWRSALNTFEDPNTNYLFYPEEVVKRDREVIQKDLTKHKLALQKNKHTDIWIALSKTLYEKFDSDPRNIFKTTQNCVARTKNLIEKEMKKDFPYLSGAKMANYWLYILDQFTDITLRNIHKISIIPDTHVVQASVQLGIIEKEISRDKLSELWFDLLKGTEITPVEMHPILWNWSRAKFKPEV